MGLGTIDIVLLVISFVLSAAIGIYHGIKGLNQTSTDYLLGGRQMKALPLAMSLTVGTVSAITIMGNAGEMYTNGTQLWVMDIGLALGMYIVAKCFIPIFYPLKMISLYTYIDSRFKSIWLRRGAVVLTLMGAYLFIGFLLLPPALFLMGLTGFPFLYNVVITGLCCSIYSSFGGVKAVVYTDVLQTLIMLVGSFAIVVQAATNAGGLGKAWDTAYHHGRIEFFNFNLDPFQRHSFWLVIINGFFFSLSTYGVNQSQTQRAFSTSSVREAQKVIYYAIVGMLILKSLMNLSGVMIFAVYADCDPLTKGGRVPGSNLEIVTMYVLEHLTKIPGLAGLFVASIYAAVLSSVSTQVNSMTALLWEDFFKDLPVFNSWSETKITRLQKVIAFITGIIGIFTSLLASKFYTFLKTLLQLTGALWGPMVGLFLVALFLPWVKLKGAASGFVVAMVISGWIVTGQLWYQSDQVKFLPLSHEGCPAEAPSVLIMNETLDSPTLSLANGTQEAELTNGTTAVPGGEEEKAGGGAGFYAISYCLNYCWGVGVCVLVSLLVTAVTSSNRPCDVDESLVHPWAWRVFSKGVRASVAEWLGRRLRAARSAIHKPDSASNPDVELKDVSKEDAHLQPLAATNVNLIS